MKQGSPIITHRKLTPAGWSALLVQMRSCLDFQLKIVILPCNAGLRMMDLTMCIGSGCSKPSTGYSTGHKYVDKVPSNTSHS